jgi:hypothetical protein
VQAVEHHGVDLAVLEVAVVEHHVDAADPLDAEASVAVVELVAEAVVSQEAVDVAAVALVDVDEEDTKRFGLGRRSPHAGEALLYALPFRLESTITHRYHDHLSAFWSCDGITVTCRKYGALLRTF